MNEQMVIFLLSFFVLVLASIVVWQHLAFRFGIQRELLEMAEELKDILDRDSGAGLMIFTNHQGLMALMSQINRLLEKHRKARAGYCRSEMASKRMLSNISHDIKTPMTVILGYLEILRMKGGSSDEMLAKTEQKAKDVMELVNQFFTLSKLESGDMMIELSPINICEVCRESVLDFYEMLTKEEFRVDISLPEKPVYVQGNKETVQRIISNLISNVIRYGDDGKYFALSLRVDEKQVLIDVTDKGKGIDKAFADSVFERLFTMEDSRSRRIQGNGLGLSIARNLTVQLGGNLTLNSIPYERTTFTISLPCLRNENIL